MPAIKVEIDSIHRVTVSADGFALLSVDVSAVRTDEEPPHLAISASKYPPVGDRSYLLWEDWLPLESGQVVAVSMVESAQTSRPGKTIDELYPEGPAVLDNPKTAAEVFADLRSRPPMYKVFEFHLETSTGFSFAGNTSVDDHGFGFSVTWHESRPERARVSLHSYTLDSLEHKTPMTDHVRQEILSGECVRFEVVGKR